MEASKAFEGLSKQLSQVLVYLYQYAMQCNSARVIYKVSVHQRRNAAHLLKDHEIQVSGAVTILPSRTVGYVSRGRQKNLVTVPNCHLSYVLGNTHHFVLGVRQIIQHK